MYSEHMFLYVFSLDAETLVSCYLLDIMRTLFSLMLGESLKGPTVIGSFLIYHDAR